ncbi:MAG TPA: sodium-independent anion transporter [Thermomonas sp.]|nr:sodium-independent anion transporter [Thermomonas sp.]
MTEGDGLAPQAGAPRGSLRLLPGLAVRRLVIAAEPVTSIDVTSADMLDELEQHLHQAGIELQFAEMKDPVKDKLRRFEILERFGSFHPTIEEAVGAFLQEQPDGRRS